jgi:nucleotide-binding universal stress UspA family protein
MKKILVPVDFSDTALGAFFFAQQLAQKMEASIDVVHIYDGSINTNQELTFQLVKGKDEVLLDRLDRFINLPPAEGAVAVAQNVNKYTYLAYNTSAKLAKLSKDYNWVVMGMTGKHKVEKKWIGSIASYVAHHAYCPVFLIPNGHQYQPVHQIVYAQNWESIDDQILHSVIAFSELVQAKIHFVHVNEQSEELDLSTTEQTALEEFLDLTAPDLNYQTATVDSSSPQKALTHYLKTQSANLLVLVNRQHGLLDNLLRRSLTKEMTLAAETPLLIYRTHKQ